MAKRQPKAETTIDGVRLRAYTTRSEIEVLVGDGDIADPQAEVWCYWKDLGLNAAMAQAMADRKSGHP